MSRRQQTEQHILQALEAQIREAGMGSIGVNAIARRAGVSKELIYRYFDGLDGLLLRWMQEQDFWTGQRGLPEKTESSDQTPRQLVLDMLRAQVDALSSNETLREVRRWELVELNEVTSRLAQRREKAARSFIDRIDGLSPDIDMPATVSVMLAGILYLMLRAKTESRFLGVPIRTEEGWERILNALDTLTSAFPESLQEQSLDELEARRTSTQPGGLQI
ncbi:TetR family transcriptional regulator [Advenella kashmirensis W13003]|uniref:TetR family transcriptional regulator n=1 Tax=Advenella kashmirensis W13003 TaxID=1424334 RepID=V8QRS7_9BURK|nr:TetR/AcrR family transcriptional regulator [Advenella kashmirensis]ETF02681.1 TetR family transcriptional regulator [Advenella kashmirensis W13003]